MIMHPEIRRKRDALVGSMDQIQWCDDRRLETENAEDVGPGGFINPFGWYVIGTTIGGNAIVVSADDPAVYFADHTWYAVDEIHYQNLSGDRSWIDLPLTAEGAGNHCLSSHRPSKRSLIEPRRSTQPSTESTNSAGRQMFRSTRASHR